MAAFSSFLSSTSWSPFSSIAAILPVVARGSALPAEPAFFGNIPVERDDFLQGDIPEIPGRRPPDSGGAVVDTMRRSAWSTLANPPLRRPCP